MFKPHLMTEIQEIFTQTKYRTFDFPKRKWQYYQEWNKAIFLHWKVPVAILAELLPKGIHIDTFEGHAYVSLVAFTMEKMRPRYLPSLACVSDFHEINVRTYVVKDNKPGVYFINIEASKKLSAYLAKSFSGLPYEKSRISRSASTYTSANKKKDFHLSIAYKKGEVVVDKTALDLWLTERYCLYLGEQNKLYCFDIHHKEWVVNQLLLERLELAYSIGGLQLAKEPDLMHYSPGVKVLAWGRERV